LNATDRDVRRVALVTGAARRIGAAIAGSLHDAGLDVAIHCRGSVDEAQALCDSFNGRRPDSARVFQFDLNDAGAPQSLAAAAAAWRGRLDLLVNNASSFYPTPLGQIDDAAWDDIVGSNLKAPLFLSQAAADDLRNARGGIINIVDIHAVRPLRDHHVYGAAKAGLIMLTKSLAKDLAPEVRVNGVAPGAIAWPESGMKDATKASILRQVPLARSGDPADIAGAVRYLALEAGYVTGQILAIDGGRSIGW